MSTRVCKFAVFRSSFAYPTATCVTSVVSCVPTTKVLADFSTFRLYLGYLSILFFVDKKEKSRSFIDKKSIKSIKVYFVFEMHKKIDFCINSGQNGYFVL